MKNLLFYKSVKKEKWYKEVCLWRENADFFKNIKRNSKF